MPPYQDSKGRWRFRFQHNGKRYSGSTAKGHNTFRAAKALEAELLKRLELHQYTGEMPTIGEFAERFLDHQATCTSQLTREGQRRHIMLHVVPYHGKDRLDSFTIAKADALKIRWAADGAGRRTINTRIDTLQRMLAIAHEWKYLPAPIKIKRLPTDDEDDETPRFLTDQDAARLVEAAAPQWRTMMLIALRTGLRIGELRGLQWGDVNLDTRSIRVARTDPGRKAVNADGSKADPQSQERMKANRPKSGKGRTLPLTPDAFECLAALRPTDVSPQQWVWPAGMWRGRKHHRARSESGCKHGLERAATAAGIADIGWHTLRHTYASQLAMRGVPLRVIQELLGHASIKQTEVYAHLAPGFANHAAVTGLDTPLVLDGGWQRALNSGGDGCK